MGRVVSAGTVQWLPRISSKMRGLRSTSGHTMPGATCCPGLQGLAVLARQGGELPGAIDALALERVGVDLRHRVVAADLLVHHGLGGRGLVGLVVAVAAVADQVDDDVLLEGHAVVDRQLGDVGHGLGIVAVDVEDGRLHHLAHVGAVERRAHVERDGWW